MPPWEIMIWLLWRAAAGVGLKMKVDGLIGSNFVLMVWMRVSRNHDGEPDEAVFLGVPGWITIVEVFGVLCFLGSPGGVSIVEIPGEVWLCGLPDEASTGEPDEVTILLRVFRLANWQVLKSCCVNVRLVGVRYWFLKTVLLYLGGCFWCGPCPCLDER